MQPAGAEDSSFANMFRERCEAAGLAVTHQRQVIFEALQHMAGHPSPEAVYDVVRRSIPSISLGTVYRTIHTFIDAGLVREMSPHHGSLRVDACTTPHHHFVCRRCKGVWDLDEADLEPARLKREPPEGFAVERQMVELVGLCRTCQQA